MKKSFKKRVAASVAFGAVLALSIVDSALAITCAANTYSPATGGSSACNACPTGTTAAATPAGNVQTFCEGIAANYYGTAGNVASAHAAVTACPYGGTRAASTSNVALSTCSSPACGSGTNAEANGGTCRCVANSWGTPLDANDAILGTVTKGCTACATATPTSAAGSTAVESCYKNQRTANTFVFASGHANKWYACPAGTSSAISQGPADHSANTKCGGIAAGYYGTAGTDTGGSAAHATVTACPGVSTNAASTSTQAVETCYKATKPTNAELTAAIAAGAGGFWNVAGSSDAKYYVCKAGTTRASLAADGNSATFCEGIAAGYYGTAGTSSAHATVTSCGSGYSSAAGSDAVQDCYKTSSATNHFAVGGQSNKYFKCPAGTAAANAPANTNANTFCEGIAADYYGTAGNVGSAHATVTSCGSGHSSVVVSNCNSCS